jgi:hypothetical protein
MLQRWAAIKNLLLPEIRKIEATGTLLIHHNGKIEAKRTLLIKEL